MPEQQELARVYTVVESKHEDMCVCEFKHGSMRVCWGHVCFWGVRRARGHYLGLVESWVSGSRHDSQGDWTQPPNEQVYRESSPFTLVSDFETTVETALLLFTVYLFCLRQGLALLPMLVGNSWAQEISLPHYRHVPLCLGWNLLLILKFVFHAI